MKAISSAQSSSINKIETLTPAQRAKLVAKRKAAYEAVHGSANAVGARAANRKMGRGDASAKLAYASFTADRAAKTGKPERSIQRDATGAKALGPDLDRVAGGQKGTRTSD